MRLLNRAFVVALCAVVSLETKFPFRHMAPLFALNIKYDCHSTRPSHDAAYKQAVWKQILFLEPVAAMHVVQTCGVESALLGPMPVAHASPRCGAAFIILELIAVVRAV